MQLKRNTDPLQCVRKDIEVGSEDNKEFKHDFPATDCAMYKDNGISKPYCAGLKFMVCKYEECNFYKCKANFDYNASLKAAHLELEEE